MRLTQIVREVRKDPRIKEKFITNAQIELVIKVFIEKIKEALIKDGEAKIYNLFTLQFRRSKGRKIKTINKKEMMTADYIRIGVKPSKDLRDIMRRYK